MGSKPQGTRARGSARDGFNFRVGDSAYIYTPIGGESRKLRFGIDPDVKRAVGERPELLDKMAAEQMALWQARMEAKGYRLVSKPSPVYRTPSPDPNERGWDWCIIEAKWSHDGPVDVVPRSVVEARKEEEQRIGAGQLKSKTGVEQYLKRTAAENGGVIPEGLIFGGDTPS